MNGGGVLVVVHVLDGGAALCGLAGRPRDWEPGNQWVDVAEASDATCGECIEGMRYVGCSIRPDRVNRDAKHQEEEKASRARPKR